MSISFADCQALSLSSDWIHIPTPGDHYSPSTGSAVMTVIHELSRCHDAEGGRTDVVVSQGTYSDHYPVGRAVSVPASRPPTKPMKVIDALAGRLRLPRWFSAQAYQPAVAAIAPDFEGVVFVHNGPEALPLIRRRAPRSRVYLYAHNDLFKTYRINEAQRLLSQATGMICVSDYILKITAAKVPTLSDKLSVVVNGVNINLFKPATAPLVNPEPVILFVGRMIEEKGAHVLIEAAKQLVQQGVSFKLRIVGSAGFTDKSPLSAYECKLREEAEPIKQYIEFTPFVDRAEIAKVYHRSDVLCVPSVWQEPLGLIVAEGMACGLPVVASDRGGISEAGGDAARYFDPGHASDLASKLKPYLLDEMLRKQDGSRCRERAEAISWKKVYTLLKWINEGNGI